MVGLGLNLGGVSRGTDPTEAVTCRAGDASGSNENVRGINKTVPSKEDTSDVCSSSGSDRDVSDDDAAFAESRPAVTTRPVGLPSLGLKGLGALGGAAEKETANAIPSPTPQQLDTQNSLAKRKPPGLGLKMPRGELAAGVTSDTTGANTSHGEHVRPSAIDLSALRSGSSETQASELTIRREKFVFFEKHCTHICGNVFVAGEAVARDIDLLRSNKITHIINCNAFVIPNYHESNSNSKFKYKPLWIQDSPGEDVTKVLYDCFDFIRESQAENGNVLVHCSQGVSRSVSVVISYLMWRNGDSYEKTFALVKERRGVANPNMGFTCQMLQWRKRVLSEAGSCSSFGASTDASIGDVRDANAPKPKHPVVRLHRMAPHSEHDPRYLVAKTVWETAEKVAEDGEATDSSETNKSLALNLLDARGSFVLQTTDGHVFVWLGSQCADSELFLNRATCFARQLFQYDGLGGVWGTGAGGRETGGAFRGDEFSGAEFPITLVTAGDEPRSFLEAFEDYSDTDGTDACGCTAFARCEAYDLDFAMFAFGERSLVARRGGVALANANREVEGETATKTSSRDGDAEPATTDERESKESFVRPKLLTYPEFDFVTMYDEDDLTESGKGLSQSPRSASAIARTKLTLLFTIAGVFVLLAPPGSNLGSFVWLGVRVAFPKSNHFFPIDQSNYALTWPETLTLSFIRRKEKCAHGGRALVFGGRVLEESVERVVETWGEAYRPRSINVELGGKETQQFWETFEAGQE